MRTVNVAGMKARLRDLDLRRKALVKDIEDRQREIKEIARDSEILVKAIKAATEPVEADKDEKRAAPAEKVK